MEEATGVQTGLEIPSWWLLDAEGQHVGPYSAADIAGYIAAGQVLKDALVWAEGRPEWQPIAQVVELQEAGAHLSPSDMSTTTDAYSIAASAAVAASSAVWRGAVAAVAAPRLASTLAAEQQDDQLAAFQAELADIDPEAAAALGNVSTEPHGDGAIEGGERPSTPPLDEQRFEDDDGTVYVWDPHLRKFVAESVGAESALLPEYDPEQMVFVPEEEKIPTLKLPSADGEADDGLPGLPPTADPPIDMASAPDESAAAPSSIPSAPDQREGKRSGAKGPKSAADVVAKHADRAKRSRDAAADASWFDLKVNTSVYVTGLPDDVTEEEFAEVFSKCGVIKPGDNQRPRVKVYRDKALGVAKGDGLVTYLKEPSVDLACRILDGATFRAGMGATMTVQPAKFEMHGAAYVPKKRGANKRQKKAFQQAEEKALGWGGFDDKLKPTEVTVILMHMFDPEELQHEAGLLEELEADVKAECERLGPVEKLRIFNHNPMGCMSVKFKTSEAAQACIERMKGRFFGGRQLDAVMWDGTTNYAVKKTETAEEQAARLERFCSGY